MKNCPQCGTENPDDGNYCRKCGYSFLASQPKEKNISSNHPPVVTVETLPETANRQSKIILMMVALLSILGIIVFGAWFLNKSMPSSGKTVLTQKKIDTTYHAMPPSSAASNRDPVKSKFIGEWFSNKENIRKTRISETGHELLIESFFPNGVDSTSGIATGDTLHCNNGSNIIYLKTGCIMGRFSIVFCKK